jgi:hypothetical protein
MRILKGIVSGDERIFSEGLKNQTSAFCMSADSNLKNLAAFFEGKIQVTNDNVSLKKLTNFVIHL